MSRPTTGRFPLWRALAFLLLAVVAVPFIGQTSTPIESSGQVRYLSTNDTQGSFTLTAGRTLAAPSNLFSLGPTFGKRYRGVEITFFGTGTAATTFDYKVWVVRRGFASTNGAQTDYEKSLFCSGTATLGSTAGVATTGGILTTDKMCDTLTVTTAAYGTATVGAYGGVAPWVYSPGGNGCARLFITELGNASDIIVEYDMTGATSANCLIERGT